MEILYMHIHPWRPETVKAKQRNLGAQSIKLSVSIQVIGKWRKIN